MRCLFLLLVSFLCFRPGFSQPIADFGANQTNGCLPLIVSLQDQSTNAVSWFWDTGIGTSTLQNPGILYHTPGVYTVSLIVTDVNGQKDTMIKENWIEVYAYPAADFSANQTDVCTFEALTFEDLSDPGSGQLVSWIWDFGDGNTSTDPQPTHIYEDAGTYPVSLQIQNQYGCADDIIVQNYITVISPNASFEGDELLACGPPLEVQFSSLGDTTGTHAWDFGEGGTSSMVHPTYSYQQNGSFSVTHIVTDGQGCKDTVRKDNYVNIGVNTLSIYAQDSSLCIGDTGFFFTNASSNSIVSWQFGDGDSASGLQPYHIFDSVGVFQVSATISDQSGCMNTLSFPVHVHDFPDLDFTVQDTTVGCEVPFEVDFVNLSTGGVQFIWEFGDGDSAFVENPTHIYTTQDSFRVSLTVIGEGGCSVRRRRSNYIQIRPVRSGFIAEPRGGCAPLYVQFHDTTTSPYPITDWSWDFGNGQSSSNPHPTITFQDTGYFDISLIIENSRGCRDTTFLDNHIAVGYLPTAAFAIDTNQACALSPVQLINQSSGATQFYWYFSDGDTAMSTHPQHGFAGTGYQDIMLVAWDRGCTDTVLMEDAIFIFEPLPLIGISERKICELPREVVFQNMSLGADTWSWLIDGTVSTTDPMPVHTFTTDGVHHVSLTVTNHASGCTVTVQDSLYIQHIVADFEPDTNRGCTPFVTRFWDRSINASDWWWEFSNGDTSAYQNPNIAFDDPGVYSATLIAYNELGCADTMVYRRLHALEVEADFALLDSSGGCVPFEIGLQDLSSGTGAVVSWLWNFGDSTFSTQSNPTHTYQSGDTYSLSLQVTDVDGCIDSVTKEDLILATQPIPEFLVNPHVNCPDYSSVFVSLSSGVGLSYWWDFGDGSGSWLANTTHTYQDTGSYTVSLTVTDVNGCDSSLTSVDHVIIQELKANFWADTTFANCPPLSVSFEADTSFPHLGVNWFWDFGNGATSTQAFPTHNYTSPGVYTVSLILESAGGCSDTMIIEDLIVVEGPTGEFSFGPAAGCPGTEVFFEGESSNSIDYEWVFGDGNTGFGQTVSHLYGESGSYVPILVMEDSLGCRVFQVSPDTISIYPLPEAQFTADRIIVCDSGIVTFIDQSTSERSISSWWWDFGDGSTSTDQFPQHFYNEIGTHDVTLVVTHDLGCSDTLVFEGFITVSPSPHIWIVQPDTIGCLPHQMSLHGNLSTHPHPMQSWNWDFGWGGATAQGQSTSFLYSQAGTYTLSLTGTDALGCSDIFETEVLVQPLPQPDFQVSDTVGCAPSSIQFSDHSSPDIVAWLWNFGDGMTSTLQSPAHTYENNGHYSISLKVWDQYGCSNTIWKSGLVKLDLPLPNIQVQDRITCPGTEVSFVDHTHSDLPIVNWHWDFGDGTTSDQANPSHQYEFSGTYDVRLIVTDSYGCTDSVRMQDFIEVLTDETPKQIEVVSASVLNNRRIKLEFETYDNAKEDFGAYWIYRLAPGGQYEHIGTIQSLRGNTFTDTGVDPEGESYCYKVVVVNHCGTSADHRLAREHCTIDLTAHAGVDEVLLNWSPYVGWSRVRAYHIFKVHNYRENEMQFLATIEGNTREYQDTDIFCYEKPSYRIMAEREDGITALSDSAFTIPIHFAPTLPTHITRVSVENNRFVVVEWDSVAIEKASQYIVKRKQGNQYHELTRQATGNTAYKVQDMSAEVGRQSYSYQVFTVDSCGDITPMGRKGTSIHLRARENRGTPELEWNPYEGWGKWRIQI